MSVIPELNSYDKSQYAIPFEEWQKKQDEEASQKAKEINDLSRKVADNIRAENEEKMKQDIARAEKDAVEAVKRNYESKGIKTSERNKRDAAFRSMLSSIKFDE